MNKITVYSIDGCKHCDMLFMFLDQRNFDYETIKIPDELTREEFLKQWPDATGFPHVVSNGKKIQDPYMTLESGLF